jgi:hypothetical protein
VRWRKVRESKQAPVRGRQRKGNAGAGKGARMGYPDAGVGKEARMGHPDAGVSGTPALGREPELVT